MKTKTTFFSVSDPNNTGLRCESRTFNPDALASTFGLGSAFAMNGGCEEQEELYESGDPQ
jgi:hypothetical protein